ncbi:MAG: AAA family ATPase [Polyangia bacterium]
MSEFTLIVENLRALRRVRFAPPRGVSVLVGPNGAGKTTLLLSFKFIRASLERSPTEAFNTTFGGTGNLLSSSAKSEEEFSFGIDLEDLSWRLSFSQAASEMEGAMRESLRNGSEVIFEKSNLGTFHRGEKLPPYSDLLGLDVLNRAGKSDAHVERILDLIRGFTFFYDPDLVRLRKSGSNFSMNKHLSSRGENAFAMLDKWHSRREHRDRYDFVVDGLTAAFPKLCKDIDFDKAGNTVFVRIYRPDNEQPFPISSEANGLLSMLVLLCDIAAAEPGGLVAIDEPENALHPFAIRQLVRQADSWAMAHDLSVVFSTHSPVLLNCFNSSPGLINLVRDTDPSTPVRLDEIKNREWLNNFCLGELYEHDEFGSNDGEA